MLHLEDVDYVLALAWTCALLGIFAGTLIVGSIRRKREKREAERSERIMRAQEEHQRKIAELRRYHQRRLRALGLDDATLHALGVPGAPAPSDDRTVN